MAAQKRKKNVPAESFCIFEYLLSQNQLSWFLQIIWKNIKQRALGSSISGGMWGGGKGGLYFSLKVISKLAPQENFERNIQISEAWKPTEDMKFRLEFFLHTLLHKNAI